MSNKCSSKCWWRCGIPSLEHIDPSVQQQLFSKPFWFLEQDCDSECYCTTDDNLNEDCEIGQIKYGNCLDYTQWNTTSYHEPCKDLSPPQTECGDGCCDTTNGSKVCCNNECVLSDKCCGNKVLGLDEECCEGEIVKKCNRFQAQNDQNLILNAQECKGGCGKNSPCKGCNPNTETCCKGKDGEQCVEKAMCCDGEILEEGYQCCQSRNVVFTCKAQYNCSFDNIGKPTCCPDNKFIEYPVGGFLGYCCTGFICGSNCCEGKRNCRGGTICCPEGMDNDDNGNCCSEKRQQTVNGKKVCCPRGKILCSDNECRKRCFQCGGNECEDHERCCGGICYDHTEQKCCGMGGPFAAVCDIGQKCCMGNCCDKGESCCNGSCCSPGERCCGQECCPAGTRCKNGICETK